MVVYIKENIVSILLLLLGFFIFLFNVNRGYDILEQIIIFYFWMVLILIGRPYFFIEMCEVRERCLEELYEDE
jgi:hypothetical protein